MDTPKIVPASGKRMTIKEAAVYLDMESGYVRTLIRTGKLQPIKTLVADGELWRWEIPVEQLDARRANGGGSKTRRQDGRNKYILYATKAELATLQKVAAEAKVAVVITSGYDKARQQKQYAKQKAKRAAVKAALKVQAKLAK